MKTNPQLIFLLAKLASLMNQTAALSESARRTSIGNASALARIVTAFQIEITNLQQVESDS